MCQAMPRRFLLALLILALLPLLAQAQRRGGSGHSARSTPGLGHRHSFVPTGYFLGDTPFFYSDYPFDAAIPEYAPSQPVIMRAAADTPSEAKPAPLLIELQGDHYVRYGGIQQSSQRATPAAEMPRPETTAGPGTQAQTTAADLAPTVLVYRDGHREEVPDYVIVGRVIYAHTNRDRDSEGDYDMSNIQLSALDIPATMRANRENGVRFVLPAGPNEVITRP
jgi:hypothetical protein